MSFLGFHPSQSQFASATSQLKTFLEIVMTTLKRSWETMIDSEEEEEPSMGRQTLPVANLPATFNGEPMDGMQYLWKVRRDARRLPSYTRTENPYEVKLMKPQAKAPVVSKPRVALPSEEWRSIFIGRFRNFRKNSIQPTIGVAIPLPYLGQAKRMPEKKERDKWWAFIIGRPECEWNPSKQAKKARKESARRHTQFHADDVGQYEVPITENVEEEDIVEQEVLVVNEFGEITGNQSDLAAETQYAEHGVEFGSGSLPTPFATPQPEERFRIPGPSHKTATGGPRHPTPTLLKSMDSRYCMHLLMYFTYWITQHLEHLASGQASTSPFLHLSQNHARWMFALLSRVDEHLTSDELSTLRALARACIAFIKDLNKNNATLEADTTEGSEEGGSRAGLKWVGDPGEAPLDERACWMVVTIITEFWGQKDLWMDAETALNVT